MRELRCLVQVFSTLAAVGCAGDGEPGGIVVQDVVQAEYVCPDTGPSNSRVGCRYDEGEFWAESDAPGAIDVRETHIWAFPEDVIDVVLTVTPGVRIDITYVTDGGKELVSGDAAARIFDLSYTLANVPPGNWRVESPKAPTRYGGSGDMGEFAVDVTVE